MCYSDPLAPTRRHKHNQTKPNEQQTKIQHETHSSSVIVAASIYRLPRTLTRMHIRRHLSSYHGGRAGWLRRRYLRGTVVSNLRRYIWDTVFAIETVYPAGVVRLRMDAGVPIDAWILFHPPNAMRRKR